MARAEGEIEVGILGEAPIRQRRPGGDRRRDERGRAADQAVDPAEALIAVRADQGVEIRDLEQYLDAPKRKRGQYRPATVDAFVAYAKEHEDKDHSTVWVHPTAPRVVAIFDDHSAGGGVARSHRAARARLHRRVAALGGAGQPARRSAGVR
jgi:hypothetical protein